MCKHLRDKIKKYFTTHPGSISAREVYFRLGREYPFTQICDMLEELKKEGYLIRIIVNGTTTAKVHYEYFKAPEKFSIKNMLKKLLDKALAYKTRGRV